MLVPLLHKKTDAFRDLASLSTLVRQESEELVGPGDTGDTLIWDIIILK